MSTNKNMITRAIATFGPAPAIFGKECSLRVQLFGVALCTSDHELHWKCGILNMRGGR